MTSPASAASATPPAPRSRLHWSVAAPLGAVAGVGSAILGVLADQPLLGLAGAVVAAVPAVLAARRVPTLQAEVARYRAEAARPAPVAPAVAPAPAAVAAPAQPLADVAPVRPFVASAAPASVLATTPTTPVPASVDLARAERPAPAVDLVKAPEPAPVPQPQHAAAGGVRAASAATEPATRTDATAQADATTREATDPRVDTAELQLIWDLGEASRTRSGRGRRARTGAEVDALPDRPRTASSHRRRARHRA